MRRYQVVAISGGYAVAYPNHEGFLVAVSDHATRATAEREARELNDYHRAAIAHKAAKARQAALFGQTRRAVRQFADAEVF